MPASNPRKSKRNNKRPADNSSPSVPEKPPPIVLKRAKYDKFQHPDSVGQESAESPPEVEEIDVPRVVDVSNIVYTLSQSFMLGEEAIFEDANLYKLGEFRFRDSDLIATRKFAKAGEVGGFNVQWVSGQAIVSRKGLPKGEWLKFPLEDDSCWQKVESFIELWMKQLRKEIKVKWTVTYQKKATTTAVTLDVEDDEMKKVFNVKVALILGVSRTYRKDAPGEKPEGCGCWTACHCFDG
jgi:hypothetical protein